MLLLLLEGYRGYRHEETPLAHAMKILWLAVLCFLYCAVGQLALAETKIVSIHQIPVAVKKTIEDQLAGAKLREIEREEDDGEVAYTVQTADKAGKDREFTVAEDGTLTALEISIEDTPPEVRKMINAQVGSGKLDGIHKTFEDDQVEYDVEMTKPDRTDRTFSVGPDGKLTSVQMTLEEIPPVVRKTIEAHVGEGKLGEIYRLIEGGETSYDAEVEHDGKTRDIIVAPNGKLESMQVFMAEVTPEAQKTIKDKIGTGKIVRIDKSFDLKQGVQPYEVEGRKDGKPLNFSVGPKGRLLTKG